MNIVCLGAGAIGGYFSNLLARAGHDVTVLARGQTLDALREHGLRIVSGPDEGDARINAVERLDGVAKADLVIVATKSYDTDKVMGFATPVIAESTVVLPLQNGVNRAQEIRGLVPHCSVLGGTVFMESHTVAPGEIRYVGGPRRIVMGGYSPADHAEAERLGAALHEAGINVTVAANIDEELWRKFVLVCAGNALTSLTRSPLGQILGDPEGRQLVGDVMREALAVGAHLGIDLGDDYVDVGTEYLVGMGANARSSMLADIEAGRRTEVDVLNGYVVDQGARLSVSVPINRVITLALRLHNKRVAGDQ